MHRHQQAAALETTRNMRIPCFVSSTDTELIPVCGNQAGLILRQDNLPLILGQLLHHILGNRWHAFLEGLWLQATNFWDTPNSQGN